jgi:hypothetical protein
MSEEVNIIYSENPVKLSKKSWKVAELKDFLKVPAGSKFYRMKPGEPELSFRYQAYSDEQVIELSDGDKLY